MKRKKMSRKGKQFGTILIALALIISVFSIAFYTENSNFIDYGNRDNGITGAVVGMEDISGMQTALPPPPVAQPSPPPAPTSTAKPQAPPQPAKPAAPLPSPSMIKHSDGIKLANDNQWYSKQSDGTLLRYDNGWKEVTETYTITATSKNGETRTFSIEAATPAKARDQITKSGFSIVSVIPPNQPTSQGTAAADFAPDTFGGVDIVKNSKGESYFVPSGKTANQYAEELNKKADVQNLYNQFLSSNKLKDDDKSKKWFKDNLPGNIDAGTIDDALGIKPVSTSKQADTVQKISLPNGKFKLIYGGKEYDSPDGTEPSDLINAKNFKKDHPTAKATGYKVGDREVYLEKGKYILQNGDEYAGEAVKVESIGGVDYEVIYSFETKKPEPSQIKIGDSEPVKINSNVLNQLKGKVGKDDALSIEEGKVVHRKVSEKTEGKSGEDSYRKTATTLVSSYDYLGLTNQVVEFVTTDKNNDPIDKKKIETTYRYDSKEKKDMPLETIETTYEKNINGVIDDQKTMVLKTNALTGEPLELEYSASHSRAGKEKEDFELLKLKHDSRQAFATFESIFKDFSGLGYFSTLFFDEATLEDMREFVDETLALRYLGTEYWESQICATYTDLDASSKGVAYVDTKAGLAAVAAHIEASKSEPAILPNGKKEILYKITFNVKNGDWDDDPAALESMEFNVVLKGEKEAAIFKEKKVVEKGGSLGALSESAIVQYSNFNYDKVCIVFEDTPSSWNLDNDELCNAIMGPSAPTSAGQSGSASSGSTDTGTGSAASEGTSEFNDF